MRCVIAALALSILAVAGPAQALERILSFHSDIDIAADAGMTVQENIRVEAEGDRIRRGIYREIPTTYRDRYGNVIRVDLDVLTVTRDGATEPWHTERRGNGVRIYVGDADVVLPPGQYDYAITYQTSRQLGFFTEHDELYWNVTGNGWDFDIDRASATVRLPQAVEAQDITLTGYSGPQGSKGDDYAATLAAGTGSIESTRRLQAREGLTLVMGWPKGVVQAPTQMQQVGYLLQDNLGVLLALLALAGSAVYLLRTWHRVGRDPQPGVIFPHYEPPAGYSPASARYVNRMKYDDKAFTAAVLNLAVKGYLSITCNDDEYTLKRLSSKEYLAPGEAKVIDKLFVAGSSLALDNENHQRIAAAMRAHEAELQRDYRNLYFKTNGALLWPSVLGSALLLGIIVVTASFVPLVAGLFALIIGLHLLFLYLLKAPSPRGRRLMDKLGGFKLYLEVAEKDDLNLRNPPELTPKLFEQYLPFAVALGVEQEWAERFSAVFSKLTEADGKGYRPGWYSGNFNSARMGSFSKSVGSQFSSAISSASRAPGSSSGAGGGGSSGGGGGGGGGGGW